MIDQVARASAEQLRATTLGDVEAGLADLHVRQERHHRRTAVGVLAAAVLAVALGWTGSALTQGDQSTPTPAHSGPSRSDGDPHCRGVVLVTCLGHHTYQFPLTRPVQWQIPNGFGVGSGSALPWTVESYRTDGQAGVTVLEDVRASASDGLGAAHGVGTSPRAFVQWVASMPYLAAGPVHTTTIDGRTAWQVRVTLARDVQAGPATCNGRQRCYSITYQPNGLNTGVFSDMAAEYTAFRLPGAGTTVVWSWIFGSGTAHLGVLDGVVHGLSWPGG